MSTNETAEEKKPFNSKMLIFLVFIVLVVAASSYYFYQYQRQQDLLLNPNKAAAEDSQNTLDHVKRLMSLPQGSPLIYTVIDKKQIATQPFFKNVENGDKVLMFVQDKKAIIYRPSTDKIIDVGPINISPSGAPTQASDSAMMKKDKPLTVAIYNGTTMLGLASVTEKKLKQKMPEVSVILKENAKASAYQKVLVIDLKGTYSDEVTKIAAGLSGEVSKLPKGETRSQTDILIIAGAPSIVSASPIPSAAEPSASPIP